MEFYYLGQKLEIIQEIDSFLNSVTAQINSDKLIVKIDKPLTVEYKETIREKIYKKSAPILFLNRVKHFSNLMNLFPAKVTFRKAKTRWGSCSHRNSISLNIALTALPKELSDYIIIHELAHIKHKNHSKEFWALVAKYYPQYKEAKMALKKFATIL